MTSNTNSDSAKKEIENENSFELTLDSLSAFPYSAILVPIWKTGRIGELCVLVIAGMLGQVLDQGNSKILQNEKLWIRRPGSTAKSVSYIKYYLLVRPLPASPVVVSFNLPVRLPGCL